MSVKLSYEEAMGTLKTNPHSQFVLASSRKHIKLMPKYIGNIKTGVVEQLDSQVFVFSNELEGVPVAYKNIRLVQNMGRIIADQTCIHFDIIADFVLFKPQIGCTLSGVINKVGRQHIGCLVHGKFNAWIPRCNPVGQGEDLMGEEIQFVVTNIFTNNNILSLKGRVDEHSFTAIKKHKKKTKHTIFDGTDAAVDDSQIEPASQFEAAVAMSSTRIDEFSPEQSQKKKRKKHKHKLEDSITEVGNEDGVQKGTDDEPLKKKRKKNKQSLDEAMPEFDTGSKDSLSFVPVSNSDKGDKDKLKKRRKIESSLNDHHCDIVTETHTDETISSNSLKKKRKKEKRRLEESFLEEGQGMNTDNDEVPRKKKKKKHRQNYEGTDSGHNLTEKHTGGDELFAPVLNRLHTSKSDINDSANVSSVNMEPGAKNISVESDEGYHSKKRKKKHKKSHDIN